MTDRATVRITSRSTLERCVRLIAYFKKMVLVRESEWRPLLWSGAYFFFVLFGYYLLRPVREAMGIARGADALPWLMTGTLVAMLFASPAFALLVSRLPRRRSIPITYCFFATNLIVFWGLLGTVPEGGRSWLGYAFYIWLSVYNLFAVSIFWAVMSDIFSGEQGKRLFGLIGIGGTLGAIGGSLVVTRLSGGVEIGAMNLALQPHEFMLVSVVFIIAALLCIGRLSYVPAMAAAPGREPGPSAVEGLRLLLGSRYLLLIAIFVGLFTILSTYLYLEQGRIIAAAAPTASERTALFARIDLWANVLTVMVQLFLTGRIMSRFGVAAALALLPAVTLAGFVVLWAAPSLTALMIFQVVRRGLHHGIGRPAREVLYTVVSPDARYKSKSFIDTFIYRAGDMGGAWSPALLRLLGVPVALAGIIIAGVWLGIAVMLGRQHRRASALSGNKHGDATAAPPAAAAATG